LFERGLCESQFDLIVEHFDATLRELDVEDQVIEHAKQIIAPLRDVFARGARDARERQLLLERKDYTKVALVVSGAYAAAAYVYFRRRK
jgi:hypothetical protein